MVENIAPEKQNSQGFSLDAIVIGSGMGALTFASIMAGLRKWRVLVLERHFKIGGFTHTFSRPGGWTWDVGLHYVGEMGHGMGMWTGRPCRMSTMCSFIPA
jgi:choline dehydrogenase-like flavoprotein